MVNITSFLAAGSLIVLTSSSGNRLDLAKDQTDDLTPIITFHPDKPGKDQNQKVCLKSRLYELIILSAYSGS